LDIRIRMQTHHPAGYPTRKPDSDHLWWVAHLRINTAASGLFVHCGAILLGERLLSSVTGGTAEMSTDEDWITTEANFDRIRTGSD